jgi:hypothetical protein
VSGLRLPSAWRPALTQLRSAADVLGVMRRVAIATALPMLVLLVAATPTSAVPVRRPSSTTCPPGHPHVIAADPHAQVYEAERNTLNVYGCAGHGRSYLLGEVLNKGWHGPDIGVSLATLAGTDVAFSEETERASLIIVRDLRTGRVLHKLHPGTPPLIRTPDGTATAIVVKSDGAVAWIVGGNFFTPPAPVYEVEAVDKTGRRLLASGVEIDPSRSRLPAARSTGPRVENRCRRR